MRESKQEGGAKNKSRQLQESGEMELERVEAGGMFSSQHNPLVGISGLGNVPSASSHAAMLNRSPAAGQSSNQQLVLQLQRQYGNHYVNQVVQMARQGEAEAVAEGIGMFEVCQENKTGLPDNLKAGIENLSGISMDDVNVHYNSSKPTQLQALAYTQGTDIYVGSGQEKHLPHEAWHVVQQKQGNVKPTMQLRGMAINDDFALESEADEMGKKAKETSVAKGEECQTQQKLIQSTGNVIQAIWVWIDGDLSKRYNMSTNSDGTYSYKGQKYQKTGKFNAGNEVVKLVESEEDEMSTSDVDEEESAGEMSTSDVDEEESDSELSQWSQSSLDSQDYQSIFGSGRRGSKQPKIYENMRKQKGEIDPIYTQSGLRQVVDLGHGGGSQGAANTHMIARDAKTKKRFLVQSATLNSVKAYAARYNVEPYDYGAVTNTFKGMHCHTEMFFLYNLTNGDENKVNNCLQGYRLIVDKPICADCWEYVKKANPDHVDDGVTEADRTVYYTKWYNPFTGKTKTNKV